MNGLWDNRAGFFAWVFSTVCLSETSFLSHTHLRAFLIDFLFK